MIIIVAQSNCLPLVFLPSTFFLHIEKRPIISISGPFRELFQTETTEKNHPLEALLYGVFWYQKTFSLFLSMISIIESITFCPFHSISPNWLRKKIFQTNSEERNLKYSFRRFRQRGMTNEHIQKKNYNLLKFFGKIIKETTCGWCIQSQWFWSNQNIVFLFGMFDIGK